MVKRADVEPDVLDRRAQLAMLTGLVRGDDVYELMRAVAPNPVPGLFTPDVAMLKLAVTAFELACPPGAEPLQYEGVHERYLPEVTFRGRVEHRNSRKPGDHRGRRRPFRRVLRYFSRGPDRRFDLRLYVERVTGIEPARPAWKAGRCRHVCADQRSVLVVQAARVTTM
jgi:hypothetical protein